MTTQTPAAQESPEQESPEQAARRAARLGGPDGVLESEAVERFIAEQLAGTDLDGKSVCIVVPDATRTCPMPLLLRAVHRALHGRVSRMTTLIALGTHQPMSEAALARHLGYAAGRLEETYPGMTVLNHEWWEPETFADLGTIPAARLAELSEGRLSMDVPVLLNRAVVEHDVALVVGPVLPHEVVGISGGNKYFFPGVAGQQIIDVSHWIGALITSAEIIGTTAITPVRALINEGASLVPAQKLAFCIVGESGSLDLHSISFGDTDAAWANAAQVCAATHVTYLDEPVQRVISVIPTMYEDIWTGAKGFYKLEPAVADGGEVILYAPHITEISTSHPEINEIGYHCRDYFVKQWDRFKHLHWGTLAHSTHLRGAGTYDAETGEERLRVKVTLATRIPEEVCRAANLGYLDPDSVDLTAAEADPDTFVVPNAGETLFRLR
ncbi:lactate racemase domain-containing protein [Intrasporangium calvum]|uniref:Lactate racemase domain-containing protein n=1 Tax=Intrasporangium calvum TaxID=53358 RepID=A0ABT5GMD9_9MICO|nr:lactate racemase domain-containing protein [Intrasporangium calvum]MDC5699234.1 lactate racemase domain-containing protein [Intrasporangium calvum]